MLAGLICRGGLITQPGFEDDTSLFRKWASNLATYPLSKYFDQTSSCNYPPLYLLVLKGIGHLEGFTAAQYDVGIDRQALLDALIRIPPCLADMFIALLLFFEGRRIASTRCGVAAAALYFLNPVSIYNSAYWGQVDAVHSAFLLGALVATNRMRPAWTGIALGLALMTKLQSIAFAPLFLFDVYRWQRWRGIGVLMLGGLAAAVCICAPFALSGSLPTALQRGYVDVIGQYERLSINAFNPWYLTGTPDAPDANVPPALVRLVADGQESVADDASLWLRLTWRRISQLIYVTLVAVILSLYASRPGIASRALCAGLLGLAFFLALTEMHERYAHPVFALLPLWAIGNSWRERGYVAMSFLALLNVIYVMHPEHLGCGIAVILSLFFVMLLAGMAGWPRTLAYGPVRAESLPPAFLREPAPPRSSLVGAFRVATLLAVIVWLIGGGLFAYQAMTRGMTIPQSNAKRVYLSDLEPLVARMGYRTQRRDRSLDGGMIHLGNRFYLRGLGTHAASITEYKIPPGYDRFRAIVGIDRHYRGEARVSIELDGQRIYDSPVLQSDSDPKDIDLPIAGAVTIRLVGHSLGPNRGDHIDWASARFVHADAESLPGPATSDGTDPGELDPSTVGQEGIQWSTPPKERSQQE
ncbi:MAG: NPCBM/NEW2 domain-containing protein [Planctomycetes bacterium]|nr:NPCBM/NEW2 domain-containing protein [Planctomycetota bacterium]